MSSRFSSPLRLRPIVVFLLCCAAASVFAGPLEDYVRHADTHYAWQKKEQTETNGATITHLELTSQQWREHLWTHHIQLVRPAKVTHPDTAFLFITGDGTGTRNIPMLQIIAERAGVIAAVITRVPNQPLYDGRKEDALIAYTLVQYLKTEDPTWPLLFPMVKSAVRAMDAVQEFAHQEHHVEVKSFVVSGASKRGWTTWLSAAVEPRVKAIAPMVIDTLNMKAQNLWAEKVYGKQSEQIQDYTDNDLLKNPDDPKMTRVRSWIDPYAYRDRYNLPKLLLLGTNDRYWTVDSLRHYWYDLPGPKLIYQTPNAGHDLGGGKEATQTLAAFVQLIAAGQPLPKMEWKIGDQKPGKGNVSVKVNQPAKAIRLWTAHSDDRDFRDDKWSSSDLEIKKGSSKANAAVTAPEKGYGAYMIEVELTTPDGHPYKLSTEARVTPDNIK